LRAGDNDAKLDPYNIRTLIKHLRANGTYLLREGKRHSIYQRENLKTEVPRHSEIVDELARKIRKDLGIPFVR
jgi:mRNA interferase HicA